jgi:hypothetical protein
MNNTCPHCIAKANDTVIGALVMKPSFKDSIKALEPFLMKFKNLVPRYKKNMSMGQICIKRIPMD